jgi:hypothetical protein
MIPPQWKTHPSARAKLEMPQTKQASASTAAASFHSIADMVSSRMFMECSMVGMFHICSMLVKRAVKPVWLQGRKAARGQAPTP